jgi:hypothetical protein
MRNKLYIGSEQADFDERFNVVFSIGDIRDMSIGNNNKSYTLNLPMTKTNKRLLKFINRIDSKGEPTDKPRLYLNDLLVIFGNLKITNPGEFFTSALIDSDDWIEDLKGKKITELDLSAYDHTLTHANVEGSWSAVYPAYRYPFIDFGPLASGETGTSAKWSPLDFIPMVSIATLIAKILEPYTVTSSWLADADTKDTFILCREIVNANFIKGKNLNVSVALATDNEDTATITPANTGTATFLGDIDFLTETTDEAGAWGSDVYTIPETGTYRFSASVIMRNTAYGNADLTITDESYDVAIQVIRGMSTIVIHQLVSAAYTGTELIENITLALDTNYYHFIAGDIVSVAATILAEATNNSAGDIDINVGVKVGSTFELVWTNVNKHSGLEKTISLEEMLPDMSQADFIGEMKRIYGLVFWMDKMKRTIYLEPWDQFISSTVIDLTSVLDNKEIPQELISANYSEEIVFKWKDDDNDIAYKEYKELNTIGPGSKTINLVSEFAQKGIDTKEHNFSSIVGGYSYILNYYVAPIVPQIIGEKPEYPYVTFNRMTNFNTRIVKWKGLTSAFTWHYEADTKTQYPKIEGLDWTALYSEFLQKMYHYIDKGRIVTVRIKSDPLFLTQFFTVINTAASEGFRPTFKLTIEGSDNYFFLQKITTDGDVAELELVLKV